MPRSNTLSAQRGRALRDIDEAASQARRSHLTQGFGQDLVYTEKLSQAKEYVAAFAINAQAQVPPYVAAEAEAWGIAPLAAAQAVVSAANQFHLTVGPAIELARMSGKIGVRSALDEGGLSGSLTAAIAALSTILTT